MDGFAAIRFSTLYINTSPNAAGASTTSSSTFPSAFLKLTGGAARCCAHDFFEKPLPPPSLSPPSMWVPRYPSSLTGDDTSILKFSLVILYSRCAVLNFIFSVGGSWSSSS